MSSSSSLGFAPSSRDTIRPNLTTQNLFCRHLTTKRLTETYPRLTFDPFLITSKPIHRPSSTNNNNLPTQSRKKPPSSPLSRRRPNSTDGLLSENRRPHTLLSVLSNDDDPSTPSPPLLKIEPESSSRMSTPSPTRLRPPSSIQITSTIKLKSQTPRCRSAMDMKPSSSTNKIYPRFILITDQEHRIESWYHQYPFMLGEDLLTSFKTKQSQQKLTVSAYFVDDLQPLNSNISSKTFLQGKPFHINNDWKKYDLIFISNNIYQQIIIYLQTIVNRIKLSGKMIKIYQVNHEEDLKKQVKHTCRQLQQNV